MFMEWGRVAPRPRRQVSLGEIAPASVTKSRLAKAWKAALPAIIVCLVAGSPPAWAADSQIRIVRGSDVVEVQVFAPNIVGIHLEPGGTTTPRALVLDPALAPAA